MANNIVTKPNLTGQRIDLVHEQTSTLEEILGKDKPQIEDPLGLLTATVDVRVFESYDPGLENTLFYRVYFPGTLLRGSDFINLLTCARPNRLHSNIFQDVQDPYGILDDWEVPDLTDKKSKEITEGHKKVFDPYWSEFVDHHRIPFMNNVSPIAPKEFERAISHIKKHLISKEYIFSNLTYLTDFLSRSPWGMDTFPFMEDWIKDNCPDIASHNIGKIGLENVFGLISQRHGDLIKPLVDDVVSRFHVWWVVGREDPPHKVGTYHFQNSGLRDSTKFGHRFEAYYHGNGNIQITHQESWVKLELENGYFKEVERYPKSIDDIGLTPLLIWSKNKKTNKRTYLSSEVPPQLMEDVNDWSNPVVGLIAATALSPEQRDQLPEKLSYEEAAYIAKNIHSVRSFSELNAKLVAEFKSNDVGGGQPLKEAQISLSLLMYANILVNEIPLFPRVEALYQK